MNHYPLLWSLTVIISLAAVRINGPIPIRTAVAVAMVNGSVFTVLLSLMALTLSGFNFSVVLAGWFDGEML